MVKVYFLISSLLIGLNCYSQQKPDYVFCGDIKIRSSLTKRLFDPCNYINPGQEIISSFGKPDSIHILHNLDSARSYHYFKSYFQFYDDNSSPSYLIINDPIFEIVINDSITIKVTDSVEKLKKRFPSAYDRFQENANRDSFSLTYAYRKDKKILPTDSHIDFVIFNNKIIRIRFYSLT
jgi:hypothetical protein